MQNQQTISFGSHKAAPAPAPAPAPEEDRASKARRGSLTHGRQAEIAREENGILNYVHNWDNRAVVSASTISKMKYSQRDMITENMKPILDELKKKHHLSTVNTRRSR